MDLSFAPTSFLPLLANVSSEAMPLVKPGTFGEFLTNSVLVALVVLALILWFSMKATKGMTLIPHKAQNLFESVVEFLFERVEGIVGRKVALHLHFGVQLVRLAARRGHHRLG
jgi:F-type H+-transporting ATPase subunit a